MSDELQSFKGSECDNIVTQSDVVNEQRYVRTTLIEERLDDKMMSWSKNDGTRVFRPSRMVVGLPLWKISPDEGHALTRPKDINHKQHKVLFVGTDGVVLPGQESIGPDREIEVVREDDLRTGSKRAERLMKKLDDYQVKALLRSGEVTIMRKGGKSLLTIRLLRCAQKAAKNNESLDLLAKPEYTTTAFSPQPGWLFSTIVETEFGGDIIAAIEGFLADPRSGSYHNDNYPRSSVLTALNDSIFGMYLSIAKKQPEWADVLITARTPELPQFAIGVVQVFKQAQTLKGFSRGRLIESITLGPEETVTVEVFSFDRTIEQTEKVRSLEVTSEMERTRNQSTTVALTTDIENTVGASIGAELGVSLPIEAVSVEAAVNNSVSAEITSRNQSTANLLTEASQRAAEKFKANHQVKTLTRREFGSENRTTRSFKNPNLGRTLNLHHFEVLGHYETITEAVSDPQFCILVETPQIGPFDRDWIRAHHDFLDEVLRHDAYRSGLEAANKIAAQEWLDELSAAEKRAKEEEARRLAETTEPPPPENYLPNKGIFATASRLRNKLELFLTLGTLETAIQTIADHLNPFNGVSTARLSQAEDVLSRWAWWTQFEAAYPGVQQAAKEFVENYDQIAERSSDPAAPDDMIAAVGDFVERFDDDWLMALKLFGAAYIIAELMIFPAMSNAAVYLYIMKLLYLPNDKGIPKTISAARADFAQHKAKQSAETLAPPAPPKENLTPETVPPAPTRAYSVKELAQAHADMGRLILHLERNAAHYNNEYFKREDPALRIERLTQVGVARYAGNRLLGFAGTRSIYPLNVQALEPATRDYLQTLIPDYEDFSVDQATIEFTMPTGGFMSEMVLGQCEALEHYLVERRRHDLRSRELQNLLLEKRLAQVAAMDD